VDLGAVVAEDFAADVVAEDLGAAVAEVVSTMRASPVIEALVGRNPTFARTQTNLHRVRNSCHRQRLGID